MVAKYDRVLLRKVDLVDWDSAAAKQAERDFGLNAIPYLRVFDARGKSEGEVAPEIGAIEAAVKRALAP